MYQSLALEAKAAGMEMPAEDREYLDGLAASLEETAANFGLSSVEELLLHNVGPGAGMEEFAGFQELYYQGKPYYTAETAKFIPTPEDLDAYFTENEDYYASNGVTREGSFVNVRHILLTPEEGTAGENGETTYSDEAWAACEEEAQAVLDQWLAGDATEDSFAALANEKSQDPGSNTNGGLYENVYKGQMVEPFENWCFDEGRVPGDYGLVKTSYGYHVMYFVSSTPIWEYYAKSGWVSQQTDDFIAALADSHPMEVDYSAITLEEPGLDIGYDQALYPDIAHEQIPDVPLYIQQDYTEAKYGAFPLVSYGCGITTLAMFASYMADEYLTPPALAARYGSYCSITGTDAILISDRALADVSLAFRCASATMASAFLCASCSIVSASRRAFATMTDASALAF